MGSYLAISPKAGGQIGDVWGRGTYEFQHENVNGPRQRVAPSHTRGSVLPRVDANRERPCFCQEACLADRFGVGLRDHRGSGYRWRVQKQKRG